MYAVLRLLLMVGAIFGTAAAITVELLFNMPLPWLLYAILLLAHAVALLDLRPLREQRRVLAILGTLALGLVTLFATPWTSRKPFLRDLWRIEPGMSEANVRRIMANYIEGTGWQLPDAGRSGVVHELQLDQCLVFRHSNAAAFNSDWGVVTFCNGRVAGIEFMAD